MATWESIAVESEKDVTQDKLVGRRRHYNGFQAFKSRRTSRRVDKNVTVNTAEIVVRLKAETA